MNDATTNPPSTSSFCTSNHLQTPMFLSKLRKTFGAPFNHSGLSTDNLKPNSLTAASKAINMT
ncbi:hypothetical protein Vi05172_g13652 [Venturia inaequalis]|nr:hypothetical protein Vi05172_g13652 [Venturia inaequalis]